MHDSNLVQALKSIKNLLKKPDSMIFTKILLIGDIFLHIEAITEFHNNEDTEFRLTNIIAADNIFIITCF